MVANIIKKEHTYDDIDKVRLYKNRMKKSVFFMIIIIAGFLFDVLGTVLYYQNIISVDILLHSFNLYTIICFALGFVYLPYHPKHYGFNTNKLRFNLLLGFVGGGIGLVLAVGSRLLLVNNGLTDFAFDFTPKFSYFIYPVLVVVQDTLTKGYLQSYFVAVFDNTPHKKVKAVILSSIIFGIYHIPFGFELAVITFVYSVITGFIYEKSRSLLGVCILHYLTGIGIFCFNKFVAF